ncbi:enoyl-CoA hydratase, partial [Mesorhizobium sp. M00.F.Ca.ET.186.01.1.1]
MAYEYIKTASEDSIGIIALNRPKILNALNLQLIDELVAELERLDRDPDIRVIVLTGNDKAFAAGADIN